MLQHLGLALQQIARDVDSGRFIPLLEADVAGYLYHLLLQSGMPASSVHLDTRLYGISRRKYDLVVGSVAFGDDKQRAGVNYPRLVVQIKVFPRWGFTAQQHRVRFKHVLEDDLPSFDPVAKQYPTAVQCEVLADFCVRPRLRGYLSGIYHKRPRTEWVVKEAASRRVCVAWLRSADVKHTNLEWLVEG